MPHALVIIRAESEERERLDLPYLAAEDVKLWLPSELPSAVRVTGCTAGLPTMELKLRAAQCEEALTAVRAHLHAKKHLINRRNKNDTGQYKSTRSRTIIGRVGDRVTLQVKKYTHARAALFELDGLEEHGSKYKELLPEHVTLATEELPEDHESSRRMNRAGGGGPRSSKKAKAKTDPISTEPSESRVLTSWIWLAGGVISQKQNGSLHGCTFSTTIQLSIVLIIFLLAVRREYLKARARKHRWTEEVMLLSEEMRRVLRFLESRSRWWHDRQMQWDDLDAEVADGLRAYAFRQAAMCDDIAVHFREMWAQGSAAVAADALAGLEDTVME